MGGRLKGKAEAEKKVMARIGVGRSCFGGSRISVARETFSGMDKNEGMLYLRIVLRQLRFSAI